VPSEGWYENCRGRVGIRIARGCKNDAKYRFGDSKGSKITCKIHATNGRPGYGAEGSIHRR